MATGNKNNRSSKKGIRFPHDLIKEIDEAVEQETAKGNKTNFSSWVIDACKEKLDSSRE